MASRRSRIRRKLPSERKRPFFDKQSGESSPFFNTGSIQPKLNVSKASDPAEKEAESAAKKFSQLQKAEKEEEKINKAEQKEEEKVNKAEKKEEEKVSKAEKEEEEPVQKAEQKEEEKVNKAEKKEEEKVSKAEKEKEEPVQKAEQKEEEKVNKAEKQEEEKPVQAKTDPRVQKAEGTETVEESESGSSSFEKMLKERKGMGFALPDDLRKEMEGQFHTSFKNVRIHTDKKAAEMCEAIHALAFTHGYDIYFNDGMYNPNALSGKELLAHELTHVVQQNG